MGMRNGLRNRFALWNPSNRTYKPLSYPYRLPDTPGRVYGICYDPSVTKPCYKVVIGMVKGGYAVFSCATNSWSQMLREAFFDEYASTPYTPYPVGASFNGSIYWAFPTAVSLCAYDIVCFDGRDEKFRKVGRVDNGRKVSRMISSQKDVYVFMVNKTPGMQIMKMEVGDDDEDVKVVQLQPHIHRCGIPRFWIHQDNVLVEYSVCEGLVFVIYDNRRESVVKVIKPAASGFSRLRLDTVFPVMENMVLLHI